MKRSTHNIFSFAIGLWLAEALPITSYLIVNTITVVALSTFVNWFIDSIGGHNRYRRTPYTHSLLGVLLVSTIVAILINLLILSTKIAISHQIIQKIFVISLVIGLSHLLLDSLTADGIVLMWPFIKKRFAFTKMRFDNKLLNGLTTLISIMLLALYINYKIA
ncbi:metal-dependent hydrolase [Ignisphaera sp. 4213-co]|uniref:Metal-dependent hydrolase n=1 Tax=Ignisphaera cupida TaxID=3050454 RepID=A0ABD4Z9J7_9CREN|nr:metal-dependent hydrolase [Ignisphaera sp. 4213-co]MDK6028763.1 metal-dependent hydrolase [Ignisphaera sp. 4213-co]